MDEVMGSQVRKDAFRLRCASTAAGAERDLSEARLSHLLKLYVATAAPGTED
jgi:hypothetical protein